MTDASVTRMPGWLKVITAHALLCIVLLAALIPRPELAGTALHAQWTNGGGPLLAAVAGILMPTAGVLFLLRRGFGRYLHVGVIAGALVGFQMFQGQLASAAVGALIVVALGAYLFRHGDVRAYFNEPRLATSAFHASSAWTSLRRAIDGNVIPMCSLAIIAFAALYLWSISGQPRMADGGLSDGEMLPAEKVLTMVVTLSMFATIFVALRRAARASNWFWLVVCLFLWPLSYAYTLLINRDGR